MVCVLSEQTARYSETVSTEAGKCSLPLATHQSENLLQALEYLPPEEGATLADKMSGSNSAALLVSSVANLARQGGLTTDLTRSGCDISLTATLLNSPFLVILNILSAK